MWNSIATLEALIICECTTVERMDKATEILLNIVELYSK